jgi:hypothetical protein
VSDKTPAQLADDAAEAVRAINHRTMSPGEDWQYPGDIYSLVANLSQMAMMLPQALEQASRMLADLNEGGHLRSDKDQLEHDLGETFYGLDDARNAAQKLYGSLNRAHQGLGPIAYKD